MSWRRWASAGVLLVLFLMVLAAVVVMVGAHRTKIVPVGQARIEHFNQAVEELRRIGADLDAIERFVQNACDSYPELKNAEVCREE